MKGKHGKQQGASLDWYRLKLDLNVAHKDHVHAHKPAGAAGHEMTSGIDPFERFPSNHHSHIPPLFNATGGVGAGETLCIVGDPGSGKVQILDVLAGAVNVRDIAAAGYDEAVNDQSSYYNMFMGMSGVM